MIPRSCRNALLNKADTVVQNVCTTMLGRMKHRPQYEIDFVSSMVENGVDALQAAWQSILNPYGVNVAAGGVFCHQSPMVTFGSNNSKRCELADLLILLSHRRSPGGRVFWRGALLQTKLSNRVTAIPAGAQRDLYSNWPQFQIATRGFDPRARNFNSDLRSGNFAFVSPMGWILSWPHWGNPSIYSSSISLSEFLVGMLYDMDPRQPGRMSSHGRQVYNRSQSDWSPTIWELIRNTGSNYFRHMGKKRGLYDQIIAKAGGDVLSLAFQQPGGTDGGDTIRAGLTTAGPGGFGVLVIETISDWSEGLEAD